MAPWAFVWPFAHDGLISSRSYSPSAFRELARHAGVAVEVRPAGFGPQVVVADARLIPFAPTRPSRLHRHRGRRGQTHQLQPRARQQYRQKVQLCLDVFETMLAESSFDFDRPPTGMEIECNLVNAGLSAGDVQSGGASPPSPIRPIRPN